ncbi:hypothetical protein VSA01S_02940 [Vibrio sagamiensis NBRC 104589]|uniref:Uncharacterized protein n=1 Tax=Vibrio sagamiensis NBRC 104589 TaxID=1219064 RepID=A0A511QCM8_9VIBR|nr:hypothetical protein VSA01S_02940 [Vibrio sagamiensis NBRC 104589]
MILPAPKKNANSIKPTAIISVSFNVCFTDNPLSNLMNVVYASTTFCIPKVNGYDVVQSISNAE